jgi:CheY-like chemotaxis protein/signal transduction histidine kinase
MGRQLAGAETEYLLRVESRKALNFGAAIYSEPALGRHLAMDAGRATLMLGVMIGISAISVLLALIRREQIFLFFGLSVFCLVGYLRTYFGFAPVLLPFIDNMAAEGFSIFVALSNVMLLLAVRLLLKRDNELPMLQSAMAGLAALIVLCLLLSPFLPVAVTFYLFYLLNAVAALLRTIGCLVVFLRLHRFDYLLLTVSFGLSLFAISSASMASWLGGDLSSVVNVNTGMPFSFVLMSALRFVAIVMHFDVHSRREHHRQLTESYRKLRLEDQSRLLSKLTHEIRTPMSGILGMNELLNDTSLDKTQREYSATIERSAQELLTIIDDVTAFAHLQSNSLPIKNEAYNVADMVDEVMQSFSGMASRKQVELISHLNSDVPERVQGDVLRTKHILHNLLDFSLSHFRDGEIFLEVAWRESSLVFSLQDGNQNLHEIQIEHLFTENDQLLSDIGGVGLPLSRQIAVAMGGTLSAHNELGLGMHFQLQLPVEEASLASNGSALDTSLLLGKRLIVIDDSKTCCDVVEAQAASWGVKVDSCMSGSEGFAMLRAKANVGEPYDILVLDFSMPGMSGLQLAEKIAEDELLKDQELLIIMLTGLDIAPEQEQVERLGIQRVIQKPLSAKALQTALLQELAGSNESTPQGEFAHIRILLAEDNEVSARVIQKMLERLGVSVKGVADGEEALRAMQRERFDLVLMDCEMPVMDGFEATALQRQWEKEADRLPMTIVALTAHILEQMEERIRKVGMDDKLSKPVRIADLVDMIQRWVPASRAANSGKAGQ